MGEVPTRLIPDQVDERRSSAAGVMKVGDAVGEARAQVQQGEGRLAAHSPVSVRRPGADPLEEAQDGSDLRYAVERRHQGHLGGSGIGEADLYASLCGGSQDALGSCHGVSFRCFPEGAEDSPEMLEMDLRRGVEICGRGQGPGAGPPWQRKSPGPKSAGALLLQ